MGVQAGPVRIPHCKHDSGDQHGGVEVLTLAVKLKLLSNESCELENATAMLIN